MDNDKTWEMVVQPDAPIDINDLQVVIQEGNRLEFPLRRSNLANMVNANWNAFIADMAGKKKDDVKAAIEAGDDKKYLGCIKHIAAISSMYRFCGAMLEGNKLELDIGVTDFKDYIGTNAHALLDAGFRQLLIDAGIEDKNEAGFYFANPFSTCANIVTSDGKVPLGIRGPTVAAYPNVPHVIGGYVKVNAKNKDSFSAKDIDFSSYMKQELGEELGLGETGIAGMDFLGIVLSKPMMVSEMVYNTRLSIDARQLEESWRTKSQDRFEHRNITFYAPEDLAKVLKQYEGKMVPSGEAALTLFLQHYHPSFARANQ